MKKLYYLSILQIILLFLKLSGTIFWSWWIVFIPLFIIVAMFILVVVSILIIVEKNE